MYSGFIRAISLIFFFSLFDETVEFDTMEEPKKKNAVPLNVLRLYLSDGKLCEVFA